MTDSNFQLWNRKIADVIKYSGTDDFFDTLIDSIKHFVDIEYPQVWLYDFNTRPDLLYHEFKQSDLDVHVKEYISDTYKKDPFYLASAKQIHQGVYTIKSLKSYNYDQYLAEYFNRLCVSDEISHIVNLAPSKVLNVSLMRSQRADEFSSADQAFLKYAEPVVRTLIQQHWTNQENQKFADLSSSLDAVIKSAADNFGNSVLTEREQQVVKLSLMGHSIKTAADKLKISTETLKKHRKHIYHKLDISSNTELYSIFLQALPCYVSYQDADPFELFSAPNKFRH